MQSRIGPNFIAIVIVIVLATVGTTRITAQITSAEATSPQEAQIRKVTANTDAAKRARRLRGFSLKVIDTALRNELKRMQKPRAAANGNAEDKAAVNTEKPLVKPRPETTTANTDAAKRARRLRGFSLKVIDTALRNELKRMQKPRAAANGNAEDKAAVNTEKPLVKPRPETTTANTDAAKRARRLRGFSLKVIDTALRNELKRMQKPRAAANGNAEDKAAVNTEKPLVKPRPETTAANTDAAKRARRLRGFSLKVIDTALRNELKRMQKPRAAANGNAEDKAAVNTEKPLVKPRPETTTANTDAAKRARRLRGFVLKVVDTALRNELKRMQEPRAAANGNAEDKAAVNTEKPLVKPRPETTAANTDAAKRARRLRGFVLKVIDTALRNELKRMQEPRAAANGNADKGDKVDTTNLYMFGASLDDGTGFSVQLTRKGSFRITDRGGMSKSSSGTSKTRRVGFGRIRSNSRTTTPAGVAIFGFKKDGILVAEAGVPAAAVVNGGRIFAEVNGPLTTGLAIANPNDTTANVSFFFTDVNGKNFGGGSLTLGANQQIAKFLDQDPFNGGPSVLGTLTFTSSVPVSVIALRGFTNERSEFLVTTLPVAPLSPNTSDIIYFPQFAEGGGWTTEIILVNPTDETLTGNVQFLDQGKGLAAAAPVTLALEDGSIGSSFPYSISARSAQRFRTSGIAKSVAVGSVRAIADGGNSSPSGLGVFSFKSRGVTVSEAGVPALPAASAFRVYVETSGRPGRVGSIRSGLAIINTSGSNNTVTLELTDLDGTAVGGVKTIELAPSGQTAQFLDELFVLPSNFAGVLRATSNSKIAVVGLRARTNKRSDFLITTTQPTNETAATTTRDRFFSHIADSGGWSTKFVLFSGSAGQSSSGTLSFVGQDGQELDLDLSQSQ